MGRIEKTVFVSYRRTDESWGLAIFQDLTQHGYDVFIDYDGIASGNFETVILENIRARAHFLVLLTPTALERCGDPKDWMRREIETALDSQRNIVPVMLAGFKFGTPAIASQLIGKLAALKEYNGLEVPGGYFSQAMERLRNRFLNVQVDAVLHPASDSAQQVAKEQKDKATMAAARLIAPGRWRMVAGSAIALLLVGWIGLYQMGVPVWVPWAAGPPHAEKAKAAADLNQHLYEYLTKIQTKVEATKSISDQLNAGYLEPRWGILESYVIKARRDGAEKHALMFGLITEIAQKDSEIVSLLETYAPYAISQEFKIQSSEFLEHARTYMIRVNVLPKIIANDQQLPNWKIFPKAFPAALQEEIALRK